MGDRRVESSFVKVIELGMVTVIHDACATVASAARGIVGRGECAVSACTACLTGGGVARCGLCWLRVDVKPVPHRNLETPCGLGGRRRR